MAIFPKGRRQHLIPGRAGFSLIEVMIVIALVGTLSAIALPNYVEYREKAKVAQAIGDIRAKDNLIANFTLDNDRLPASLAEIGLAGRLDPWGTFYQYLRVAGTPPGALRKDRFLVPVNSDYDLYSMGRDRSSSPPFTAKASQDDIVPREGRPARVFISTLQGIARAVRDALDR